jgi:hypothetical protein
VIGQIIGASNYEIGHLGLGQPGGGVANLGVVGGSNKAGGCTGLPTPVGDFFAVDYVAHEIGHQFAGNHTFNGTQSNCSGGNRSAANSFEPGSGSSIMAYAGICQQDNLQPHSDPYWSHRSFTEITALVTGDRPPINEVQNVSLTDFSGGNETQTFQLTGFGGTDSFQLDDKSGGHPLEEAERSDKDDCDAVDEKTHKAVRKEAQAQNRSFAAELRDASRPGRRGASRAGRDDERIADLGSPLLAAGCWEAEPWTARSRSRKGPAPQGAKQGSHGGHRRKPESVTAGNRLGRGPRSAKRRRPQGRRPKCQERRSEPD